MDLQALKLLVQVVEAGGVAKAASLLGMPQSQVSRQILELERRYGGQLLHRTGRGVTLSELGRMVYPQVLQLLADADRLELALRDASGVAMGEVGIGILSSFVEPMAVPLYGELRRALPQVRLKIFDGSSGQLEEWLATGKIDIGMVVRNQGARGADWVLHDAVVLHLIGAPGDRLLQRADIGVREMAGLPLILPGQPSGIRPLLDDAARQAGVQLRVELETDCFWTQLHLAMSGRLYTILGPYAFHSAMQQGRLGAARIVDPMIKRSIGVSMTNTRPASLASREASRVLRRCIEDVTLRTIGL
ncbi:LysR family transcriptional regulator [Hydrogenophaga sp.]|uniref:LysR family transcriptional regulator n=1 Tax=Hydrogenophaga sp. TaxID=1904254 RepID=UPI00262E9ABB|nr:LysR family transcriptional regulator [Hydrogenophaga sp.]MCW5654430.1 LysR family transcriptional regulator [Hydrogenophaga sp.]